MAVSVVTPAASFNLAALATVQSEIAELAGEGNASRAARKLAAASSRLASYCDRIFARQTYRETVPGYGTTGLVVMHFPVLMDPAPIIHRISDDSLVTDWSLENPDSGVFFRASGWTSSAARTALGDEIPGTERPAFEVEYAAGYVLPADDVEDADVTLPAHITEACIALIRFSLAEEAAIANGQSVTLGKMSVDYGRAVDRNGVSLPAYVANMLQSGDVRLV